MTTQKIAGSLRIFVYIGLLFAGVLLTGLSGCPEEPFSVVVLETNSVEDQGQVWPYYLVRLKVAGKQASYAQWFPSQNLYPAPVVMLTQPYDTINWSGELIDYFQGDALPPDEYYGTASYFLHHGFSVLFVFGRFYAGGDIQNEVDDMAAGLKFLSQEASVDKAKIAIYGSSWGGFEALYAAANAPPEAIPVAGVATYPLSDFEAWVNHLIDIPNKVTDPEKISEYETHFAPFVDRIYATTGGPPGDGSDYTEWNLSGLLNNLQTPFLVLHDVWDTLVPFEQSSDLVEQANHLVEPVWFLYEEPPDLNTLPLDHGAMMTDGYAFPFYGTLTFAYLFTRIGLADQELYIFYDQTALHDFLVYLKGFQIQGYDMNWAAPRLLDLVDKRVLMYELTLDPPQIDSGACVIVQAINEIWGTSLTQQTVVAALAQGLPIP